jgi:tetratricopeptide (TPR) repeat protein
MFNRRHREDLMSLTSWPSRTLHDKIRDVMTHRILIVATAIFATAGVIYGQSLDDARKSYDAGAYQQAIDAIGGSQDPRLLFIAAQSQQKLRRADDAKRVFGQLAARPDAWGAIGRSAVALLGGNANGAVQEANQAVGSGASIAEAHLQRGLALSAAQSMDEAAAAFQKASDLDPSWSYAHYYAGIAYSKVKRADLTASHFQAFLRLAPNAPERGEVQSILRTLSK